MDSDAHLAWAKQRALAYVERGELLNAVTSMSSDLDKHPHFRGAIYDTLFSLGMLEVNKGPEAVRRWINGFR